jgi:hypothetical protein
VPFTTFGTKHEAVVSLIPHPANSLRAHVTAEHSPGPRTKVPRHLDDLHSQRVLSKVGAPERSTNRCHEDLLRTFPLTQRPLP